MTFDKALQWSISQDMIKKFIFHTHVPCKSGDMSCLGQLKVHASLVNATITYGLLLCPQLFFFIIIIIIIIIIK